MSDLRPVPQFDQDLYIRCQQKAYDDGEGQALVLQMIIEYKSCHRQMKREPQTVPAVCSHFQNLEAALREYLQILDIHKACSHHHLI